MQATTTFVIYASCTTELLIMATTLVQSKLDVAAVTFYNFNLPNESLAYDFATYKMFVSFRCLGDII